MGNEYNVPTVEEPQSDRPSRKRGPRTEKVVPRYKASCYMFSLAEYTIIIDDWLLFISLIVSILHLKRRETLWVDQAHKLTEDTKKTKCIKQTLTVGFPVFETYRAFSKAKYCNKISSIMVQNNSEQTSMTTKVNDPR